MEPIISAAGLGKVYRIYHRPADRIMESLPFSKKTRYQELWALRGVNLRIFPGEAIGFIGSNGAGKSTLLKLITGISQPSEGSIAVKGRISALMELGAGFHWEFTGRENIYMNCSILGMSKKEIDRRLSDIIAFSELGDFIDRPIKIYSSGMFMRLGFSVAINTDPDVLVIDEILAVGDEYFQSKCYRKIREFREQGKTVIFVSHAVNTIRGLCGRVVWLDGGVVRGEGDSLDVTDAYLNFQRERIGRSLKSEAAGAVGGAGEAAPNENGEGDGTPEADEKTPPAADGGEAEHSPVITRQGTREGEIFRVEFLDGAGNAKTVFEHGETLVVRLHFRSNGKVPTPNIGVSIWRNDNVLCYGSSSAKDGTSLPVLPPSGYVDFILPQCALMIGDYETSVAIFCPEDIHPYDFHNRLHRFQVRTRRRDEGVFWQPHRYRYVLDGGKKVLEMEAER